MMSDFYDASLGVDHDQIFLGKGHVKNEPKTWGVIVLARMAAEIIGGHLLC